jgi:hypothetical protein
MRLRITAARQCSADALQSDWGRIDWPLSGNSRDDAKDRFWPVSARPDMRRP